MCGVSATETGTSQASLSGVGRPGVARHVYAPLPPQGNNRKQVSSRVCKSFSSCPKEAGPMVGGSPVGVFHDSALQERSSKQPAASPARITIAAIRSAGSWPPRVFLQWVNFVKLQNHARGPSLCRQVWSFDLHLTEPRPHRCCKITNRRLERSHKT